MKNIQKCSYARDEKLIAVANKKNVLSHAKKLKVQLEENEVINVKEIKSELETLEQEKKDLVQNQKDKIKLLDDEKVAKIIELNKKIRILQKRQRRLLSRRNTISDNLENNTISSKVSFAGPIPKKIHPELKKLADKIGGVGSHGLTDKNIVGVCAEFQTVNKMLWSGSKLTDIKLTKPIRLRTGKEMPFCANCAKMFKDLID